MAERKIRVLLAKLGLDSHTVGVTVIAQSLRDAGMEVIYTGCFNTPETIVQTAIEEDADVIGISSHSWEYLYYTPELLKLLEHNDCDIPVVIGGSVITEEDAASMLQQGVAAVFGSGAVVSDMVNTIESLVAGETTS